MHHHARQCLRKDICAKVERCRAVFLQDVDKFAAISQQRAVTSTQAARQHRYPNRLYTSIAFRPFPAPVLRHVKSPRLASLRTRSSLCQSGAAWQQTVKVNMSKSEGRLLKKPVRPGLMPATAPFFQVARQGFGKLVMHSSSQLCPAHFPSSKIASRVLEK